jgi:tetratricopeptide (TPR) repeat protein
MIRSVALFSTIILIGLFLLLFLNKSVEEAALEKKITAQVEQTRSYLKSGDLKAALLILKNSFDLLPQKRSTFLPEKIILLTLTAETYRLKGHFIQAQNALNLTDKFFVSPSFKDSEDIDPKQAAHLLLNARLVQLALFQDQRKYKSAEQLLVSTDDYLKSYKIEHSPAPMLMQYLSAYNALLRGDPAGQAKTFANFNASYQTYLKRQKQAKHSGAGFDYLALGIPPELIYVQQYQLHPQTMKTFLSLAKLAQHTTESLSKTQLDSYQAHIHKPYQDPLLTLMLAKKLHLGQNNQVALELLAQALEHYVDQKELSFYKMKLMNAKINLLSSLNTKSNAQQDNPLAIFNSKITTINIKEQINDAFIALQTGKKQEAKRTLQKVYDQNPNPVTAKLLGYAYLQQQAFDKADDLLTQSLDAEVATAEELIILSNLELIQGDYAQARQVISENIESYKDNFQILNAIALSYLGEENFDQAIIYLTQSLAIETNQPKIYALLAQSHLQQGKPAQAKNTYMKGIQNSEKSLLLHYQYLQLMSNKGQEEDFKTHLKSLHNHDDPEILALAAMIEAKNNPELASSLIGRALATDGKSAYAMEVKMELALQNAYQSKSKQQMAKKIAIDLLSINPNHIKALMVATNSQVNADNTLSYDQDLCIRHMMNYPQSISCQWLQAQEYLMKGHYRFAYQNIQEALQIEPQNPFLVNASQQIALVYAESEYQKGQTSSAIALLEMARALNPNNVQIQSALTKAYTLSLRLDKAEVLLEELESKDPEGLHTLSSKAMLSEAKHEYDGAIDTWQTAWKQNPKQTKAPIEIFKLYLKQNKHDTEFETQKIEAHLTQWTRMQSEAIEPMLAEADWHYRQGNFDLAIQAFEKAIPLSDSDDTQSKIYNNIAWLLQRSNRADKALPIMLGITQNSPNDAQYLETLGCIYLRLGRNHSLNEMIEKHMMETPEFYFQPQTCDK